MKSRWFVLLLVIVCKPMFLLCQHVYSCGQHEVMEHWFNQHQEARTKFDQSLTQRHRQLPNTNSTTRDEKKYTIPVVFHILHNDGPENISEAQVLDQIRILNRDFQKMNPDTASIVEAFKNNIANVGFEFKLATIDPEGNCTNGIIRHKTAKTQWKAEAIQDFIYSWPREKYLNIYVVRAIDLAPAYTFLPGVPIPPNADVIVTQHNLVGSIGTSSVLTSRAITHEVGHWFGLPHIWGITNSPGVACGDDFVEDTPITKGFVVCTPNNAKVCDPNIVENVQNYMDYSPCKIMFTNGQAAYMRETIDLQLNDRDYLVSEENLKQTGVVGNEPCRTKVEFYTSAYSICKGSTLTFYNNTYSVGIDDQLEWRFQSGVPAISSDSVVEVVFPEVGVFEVKLVYSGSNGTDSLSKFVEVTDGLNGKSAPWAYGFDDGFLSSDLAISNLAGDGVEWKLTQDVGANGTRGCIFINNFDNDSVTTIFGDYFETPYFDLTNVDKPQMSYYYAYARKYEDQNDSFRLEYTFDCGSTWKRYLIIPSVATMANSSGGTTSDIFIPGPDDWQLVNLKTSFQNTFKNKPSVKFRFYFNADPNFEGSNNLYLDEINIVDEVATSLDEVDASGYKVYPNPTSGVIRIQSSSLQDMAFTLYNAQGMKLEEYVKKGNNDLVINEDGRWPAGLYILSANNGGRDAACKKIVILP